MFRSETDHILVFQYENLKNKVIIIGIQPLGRSGQRPEFSQATGMALVRCILGKFLRVAYHCFPPLLDVPTFHRQVSPRPPRRERSQRRKWELWARMLSGNFAGKKNNKKNKVKNVNKSHNSYLHFLPYF